MKVSVLQENLAKGLGIVGRAVASRSTLPVLSNILMATDGDRLKLSATNLEIGVSCWLGAKVETEGSITVPGRLLSDLIGGLPRERVDLALDEQEVAERFVDLLGKSVIVVGPSPQPIGHIDMMLTPLGDRRLVLADSGWGAGLAERELVERPAAVRAFERRCEQLFFGDAEIAERSAIAFCLRWSVAMYEMRSRADSLSVSSSSTCRKWRLASA